MRIALLASSAILPALALLWVFYKRDVNPEPRDVLLKTFLRGVVAVVPVVLVAAVPFLAAAKAVADPVLAGGLIAFGCAAFPEEFFKYRVLTRYSARHPAFNEPMDGVVYGVTASLGFAALENVAYVLTGGWEVAIARAITAVPEHACLGAIMGYYVGQARFTPHCPFSPWRGFWVAVLLHGLYDFPMLALEKAGESTGAGTGGVDAGQPSATLADGWVLLGLGTTFLMGLVALVWAVRIVRRLRREQLAAAPAPGCQAADAQSTRPDAAPC